VNSSRTWKSGERVAEAGLYRCVQCHLEGRETLVEAAAGSILPLCVACPGKDATWRLIRAGAAAARS
jgi:hypothetical protein